MAMIQEIQVPLLAVNDTTLTVVEITLDNGAPVKKGDLIMVFETSKTTYDVEAPADGYIQYRCEADKDYEVGQVVAMIYSDKAEALEAPVRRPGPGTTVSGAAGAGSGSAVAGVREVRQGGMPANGHDNLEPAAPVYWEGEAVFSQEAERLIAVSGLDKAQFKGKDFVSGADVQRMLTPGSGARADAGEPRSARTAQKAPGPISVVDPEKAILEKLSSAKRREIEYLSEVQATGLTSTVNTVVEVEGIFTHINPALRYLKDSLLPVIVYEASRLLAGYQLLNAWFNGDGVAVYRQVNIGFAIDIDKGLKVVKIAGAGEMSIGQIESDILQLSGRYLDDNLRLDDLTDISFTISDLSAEGVAFFRPLINKMNSAILGVSAIDERFHRCTLSLSFDHRVTEGKLAARFLSELKARLESYRPKDNPACRDISCFKCYKTLREDLAGTGFVRCVTPEGKDGYICQSCIKGF